MSSGNNNFMSIPGDWWTANDYGTYVPSNSNRNNQTLPMLPRHIPFQATLDGNRDEQDWQLIEDSLITLPLGFAGFPLQPHPPLQVLLLNSGITGGRLPGFLGQQHYPQGFMGHQNFRAFPSTQSGDSRLTQDEQNQALKKLKKEIYNPVPKRITSRLSMFYRERTADIPKERTKGTNEEGKRCAVCLEDFEPKELVMLTPCEHMFHEDCIVPWVKSNGQCPVCRFALCGRMRSNYEGDILSVIRASEEVLRGNGARW